MILGAKLDRWQRVFMGPQSSSSPRSAILLYLSLLITLLLKLFKGKILINTISDFVLFTAICDFQHCFGICLMSAEIDEVSKGTVVSLVSERTTFYKKLWAIHISAMVIFCVFAKSRT